MSNQNMNSNLQLKNISLVPNGRQIQTFYSQQVRNNILAPGIWSDGCKFRNVRDCQDPLLSLVPVYGSYKTLGTS